MSVSILGIRVDTVTRVGALKIARWFLTTLGQYTVFTPNPEMLVKAQSDKYFEMVLNGGSLNICDGFGLWMAMKIKRTKDQAVYRPGREQSEKFERITGADFMLDLCGLAAEQGSSVYLLGSGGELVVKKAVKNLRAQFPSLNIAGYNQGPEIQEQSSGLAMLKPEENRQIINAINDARPSILFVAFGMGKQEKWIQENLLQLPGVKIAMGVGGAFDYLSGFVPRAPGLLRKFGLEWLYRLVKQPRRAGRIFDATIKFMQIYGRSLFY